MPNQSYALEEGGEKRLMLSWKGAFNDLNVELDGRSIGMIPNQKALIEGQTFPLEDGSTLKVQLNRSLMSTELQVLRDGQPLPGSASDPHTRYKNAYMLIYFIAGLNLVLGILASVLNITLLQDLGIGFASILVGMVYLILGFFVQRKSSLALILAIILFAADSLFGVVVTVMEGGTPGIAGLLVRVLLLIPMFQGVPAIKALKSKSN
jgi:hypothetical protein